MKRTWAPVHPVKTRDQIPLKLFLIDIKTKQNKIFLIVEDS